MATASRIRQPGGAKPRRRSLAALRARDAAASWLLPVVAGVVLVIAAALGAVDAVPVGVALVTVLVAALVLLLFTGLHPLLASGASARSRALGAGLAVVWAAACYLPFHLRIFPGAPLVAAEITAAGGGLPVRIPAAGRRAVDVLLGGRLAPGAGDAAATPVDFTFTLEEADGTPHALTGRFEDTLHQRRLGRRGSAVVHDLHTSVRRVVPNAARGDLTVTRAVVEPPTAAPVTVTAYAHPLPGPVVLAIAAAALLGATVAFDRFGPIPDTDGALTLATAGVLGTAVALWTSDVTHVEFRTLIGAAILGGAVGVVGGGTLWWLAKRLVARPAR